MARTSIAILVVIIIVTAIFLMSRRTADRTGSRPIRTTSNAAAVQPERTGDGTGRTLPSKSATRTPRPESKTITTASGLQYEVLAEGSGPRPGPTDLVQVHYQGTTLDGTVFDSSIERGKPTTLPLDRVIKGWAEGLQLMPVGSRFRFTIPPELAYGERGTGSTIGPDETLVFEVELLEIPPKP